MEAFFESTLETAQQRALLSDEASFITGGYFLDDGGYTMD